MKKALLGPLAAAVLALGMGAAAAQDFQPAIIYDLGGKFDKSFNEAAYNGAERFKEESGVEYLEFEVTNESQRDQALRRMARRGATIVVAVGFSYATPLETIAAEFPDTQFTIIDSVVEQPNVQSVVFKEHEGSFPGRYGRGAQVRGPARSASSAAWTFRSSEILPMATSRA